MAQNYVGFVLVVGSDGVPFRKFLKNCKSIGVKLTDSIQSAIIRDDILQAMNDAIVCQNHLIPTLGGYGALSNGYKLLPNSAKACIVEPTDLDEDAFNSSIKESLIKKIKDKLSTNEFDLFKKHFLK